jgi:type II secretory pathway component PulF
MKGLINFPTFVAGFSALRDKTDRWRFSGKRADYYDYLSALLHGLQGGRTLKDIFELDARRYGHRSVRGRLSSGWAAAYQAAGGDLYATWLDSFPMSELVLLRAAQSFGNTVLLRTFSQLAQALQLIRQSRGIMLSTLWSAALALAVLLIMLMAMPLFTVPHLLQAFGAVPVEYYGSLTRGLVDVSASISSHWAVLLVLGVGGGALTVWSMPNTSGPIRRQLERYALWRIYRYVHALRFLTLVAIVLGKEPLATLQLRSALTLQLAGASPWQATHIKAMLDRIDVGLTGADTFDTGLLDQEMFWFLTDMTLARGLHEGLLLTCRRLEAHVLGVVARQALALRWALLLSCLGCLLAIGLWHYAVIDELRRSLMLFYASQ